MFILNNIIPKKSLLPDSFSSTLVLIHGSQAEWRHSINLGVPSVCAKIVWQKTHFKDRKLVRAAGDTKESAPSPFPNVSVPVLAPAMSWWLLTWNIIILFMFIVYAYTHRYIFKKAIPKTHTYLFLGQTFYNFYFEITECLRNNAY